jgi:hypothetical protein
MKEIFKCKLIYYLYQLEIFDSKKKEWILENRYFYHKVPLDNFNIKVLPDIRRNTKYLGRVWKWDWWMRDIKRIVKPNRSSE